MQQYLRTTTRICWLTLAALSLAGCSIAPAFGPSSAAINNSADEVITNAEDVLPFRIVDVSTSTLPPAATGTRGFPAAFQRQGFRSSDEIIEVADKLTIQIWEISGDGLFASSGRRETVLQATVDNSGTITVPYANTIAARGLTTAQLRAILLERFRGQAVDPEIVVTITETQSRAATVMGSVRTPGRAAIAPSGIRLLDLLAQAGGVPHSAWEVRVTIQRATASATLMLSDILASTSNNIVVLPGDIINVTHVPRRFAVYGAINRPGNIEIPMEQANLAYLLAETGGLNDRVAQTRSVYVFRPATAGSLPGNLRATAYRFDFSKPDTFLLAGMFHLEPTDIIYVASADTADFQRFVSIVLTPILGSAVSISEIGN